jgi:hypothetical protein
MRLGIRRQVAVYSIRSPIGKALPVGSVEAISILMRLGDKVEHRGVEVGGGVAGMHTQCCVYTTLGVANHHPETKSTPHKFFAQQFLPFPNSFSRLLARRQSTAIYVYVRILCA